jgi:hypothetical protein
LSVPPGIGLKRLAKARVLGSRDVTEGTRSSLENSRKRLRRSAAGSRSFSQATSAYGSSATTTASLTSMLPRLSTTVVILLGCLGARACVCWFLLSSGAGVTAKSALRFPRRRRGLGATRGRRLNSSCSCRCRAEVQQYHGLDGQAHLRPLCLRPSAMHHGRRARARVAFARHPTPGALALQFTRLFLLDVRKRAPAHGAIGVPRKRTIASTCASCRLADAELSPEPYGLSEHCRSASD